MVGRPNREGPQSAVCESCWISEHAVWEPESVDFDGNILVKLKSVRVPEKLNTGEPDSCSVCGELTIAGIYTAQRNIYEDDRDTDSADAEGYY